MSLTLHQPAPLFAVTDIFDQPVELDALKGRKVYLAFQRNAGCPVCHLRVHQLLQHARQFEQQQILVLLVYESPAGKMREYLDKEQFPFYFIADPDNRLYDLYNVERSTVKLMKSLFHGAGKKMKAGKKLFTTKMRQDGNTNRIPAEFLIDEEGLLKIIHYQRFIGDELPVGEIK